MSSVWFSRTNCLIFVGGFLILTLLRWLVGLHGYSGAGTPPLFGDLEAQRHWMEVTTQIPLHRWYWYDLPYWGIDYPPLTAYISWIYGQLAIQTGCPELVELEKSRGIETATLKHFMRMTVLSADWLLFFPSVFFYLASCNIKQKKHFFLGLVLILAQPAFILIDHGHFQYNNIALALTLLATGCLHRRWVGWASFFYCLALNFKQMTLYYAPAFFFFLLAKAISQPSILSTFFYLFKLAAVVIATFSLLWSPFCIWSGSNSTCLQSLLQVVHRIFPVGRGLFEDKVANFWCVVDLIFKIRRRLTQPTMIKLCAFLTALSFCPSVFNLMRSKPSKLQFILSLFNCSMSFFLFSYQVHEKTILFPLLPLSLLFDQFPVLSSWFGVVSTFSMFFLLEKDGLVLPYIALQIMFIVFGLLPFLQDNSAVQLSRVSAPGFSASGHPMPFIRLYVILSLTGVLILHLVNCFVPTPKKYPHIHMYLFAIYSFGHFFLGLCYCTYWQCILKQDNEVEEQDYAKLCKTKKIN